MAQIPALILLCYLDLHVGDSEALVKAEALAILKWASKQINLIHHPEAKSRLELYQSRGHLPTSPEEMSTYLSHQKFGENSLLALHAL